WIVVLDAEESYQERLGTPLSGHWQMTRVAAQVTGEGGAKGRGSGVADWQHSLVVSRTGKGGSSQRKCGAQSRRSDSMMTSRTKIARISLIKNLWVVGFSVIETTKGAVAPLLDGLCFEVYLSLNCSMVWRRACAICNRSSAIRAVS